MSKPVVVVFTANSNTGGAAIEYLLNKFSARVTVRGIVRKLSNADHLKDTGIEIVAGDIAKPLILGPVFKDCNVALFSTPTTTNRAELGKKFVDACIDNGVQYGIIVSVLGADLKRTQYQQQFAEIEEYAKAKAGTPVKLAVGDKGKNKFTPIILRCAPFYQNFYGSLVGIQSGVLHYPLGGLGKMAHVDFQDVGKVAAHIMVNPEPHSNKVYNLIGDIQAGNQIAAAIQMKASVHCSYETVPDEIAVMAFEALGLQSWIANGNVETLKWLREGGFEGIDTGDVQRVTGEPATRFGDFVKDNLKPMLA